MSKTVSVATLEARKADLQRQLKEIDGAIKAAKAREVEKKSKAITAALAARGLLDGDLDTLIAKATPGGNSASVQMCTPQAPETVGSASGNFAG
jgi:hypothetical protein